MADDRLFRLEIISPDRVFYQGDVAMVELTTSEGDVGIYKNHIPMTMIVVPGIVTITEEEGQKKAALHSGFIEVLQDKVTILAELAEWPDEIDLNRAEEARVRAQRRLETADSSMNMIRANMALRKALVRIELAEGKQK
ncbi:ATP synthase F1 subunit epsilon [Diplocloster hominis]|uniref:ATP synthase F1 subunit epsilon n=1 Tax=Diplocloster hominis TaxID=3079010 RepID=UPI0031BA2E1B